MVSDKIWKEGQIVSIQLDGETTREMRVVSARRTGPGTVNISLEAVSGPDEIVCTCPYIEGPSGVRMGTSLTCEMHGKDRPKVRTLLDRARKAGVL